MEHFPCGPYLVQAEVAPHTMAALLLTLTHGQFLALISTVVFLETSSLNARQEQLPETLLLALLGRA